MGPGQQRQRHADQADEAEGDEEVHDSDTEVKILDQGYVRLVEAWGSDERIIEAARMSTQKGFLGWGPKECPACGGQSPPADWVDARYAATGDTSGACGTCHNTHEVAGDEKLLKFLWDNRHATPFEMAGMTIEVKAPLMVFREWHR
jgi:thymidylate synthase ThyX